MNPCNEDEEVLANERLVLPSFVGRLIRKQELAEV